jgi:hypothetical protein
MKSNGDKDRKQPDRDEINQVHSMSVLLAKDDLRYA